MPLPKRLARINRSVTNRVIARFAGRIPPLAIVRHIGRTSGKSYATPIMVFKRADSFVIVMTYGIETDWSRNVLAAGGCALEYRGELLSVSGPRLAKVSEVRDRLPWMVRTILKRIKADDVMVLLKA